jgi:aspartyl-tRNA(Asn)/glutamyl-tRNA(Gln) amidotransferase subunit A
VTATHTIESAAAALREGRIRSADLVEASLTAIREHGDRTNAFILVDAEGAREAARAADEERERGVDRGPLHGIPLSIKDLIDVAGQPTTAASRVRAGHVAQADAPVVQRLRDAGAVLIGKTNLHEFALGTTSEDSAWGPVRNPHDPSRSAGGSSGGSAAAVATGMGLGSIGSDTGGSIRIPASACGIVGLKPSLGDVPTDGVVPLSMTLDHVGPIARSVQDAAWLWAALARAEMVRLEPPAPRALTLGLLDGYFTALLAGEVRTAFEDAVARLRDAGASLSPRSVIGTESIIDTYVSLALPEAAFWHAHYLETRAEDYQPAVLSRLESGRAITAASYLKARRTRLALTRAVDAALEGCHALVLPTLPIVAPPLGAIDAAVNGDAGETLPVRSAMLRLTQLFNITGHPAISIPIQASGLPVGLQLIGRRGATEQLLTVARACEEAFARSSGKADEPSL